MGDTIHIEVFKVRHYEVDAYGHLNNAVYLRYMQEAGIEAAAAVGLDQRKHEALERIWLPRRTEIEYLSPVRLGETIEVVTWNSGFRRVIGRRLYEFRKMQEGDIVAKAHTDWVFLDRVRLTPVTIPPEIKSALNPDISRMQSVPRQKFPEPPVPPAGVFKVRHRVEWQDVDLMRHLNNAAYLDYAMDAAVQLTAAYGWPMKRLMEEGIAFVARSHKIEYIKPAQIDDELEISTWLFNIRPATVTRHFEIVNAGTDEILARIQTLWVMLDLSNNRPMRIPDFMLELLAPNISDS